MGHAGKSIRISPFRRLVIDLMGFSQRVPTVTVDRRMKLDRLIEARLACSPRPTWTALFTKAYALVAAREPMLRRCYMAFPWGRFYEHPKNIATLNIGRHANGENVVLQIPVRSPENRSLADLDALIHHVTHDPVTEIKAYNRAVRLSHLPKPIRRVVWWMTLNLWGRRRCHNFGTFGLTSVAGQGAGLLNLVPLLTTTIHYGLFDDQGTLDVRLAFDHRVLDGADAAAAILNLEKALVGEILDEVIGMQSGQRRVAA